MKTRLPKPLICMILPLLAVLLVLTTADTVSAQESPVDWTSFVPSSVSGAADGTAAGTLTTGSETANVSYAGDVRQGGGATTIINTTGAGDRICVDGSAGDVHTITFSQPVLNPRYNLFSLGRPNVVIEWDFADSFTILNSNGFLSNPSGNILRGNEGTGNLQFSGVFTQLSWTTLGFEQTACFQVFAVVDTDGDGVGGDEDLCPDTFIPEETVPSVRLGTNRWALVDDDFDFDTTAPKGKGPTRSYNTTETGGCSCEQIIDELGLGNGHTKFGCSISAMDDWVDFVNPSKRGAGADATEVASVPEAFVLEANYPNPFNPQTTIRFGLLESAQIRLVVYDVLGREVRVLVDGVRAAGTHEIVFEAGNLPSGTYLYRLETPEGSFVQTMQLVK